MPGKRRRKTGGSDEEHRIPGHRSRNHAVEVGVGCRVGNLDRHAGFGEDRSHVDRRGDARSGKSAALGRPTLGRDCGRHDRPLDPVLAATMPSSTPQ